jgi:hypothetical protein
MIDRSKSLRELDGTDWGEPTFDSHLVVTCHQLRRKPLNEFTVEDLRIMVGQNISAEYLIPLAVEELERNPFAEGVFYPGDLLWSMLSGTPPDFWKAHPDLANRVTAVVLGLPHHLNILSQDDQDTIGKELEKIQSRIEQLK